MRSLAILGLLLALGAPLVARADEVASTLPPADREAIHAVINGQIAAFRSGDDAAAYGFASPGIQAQSGDAGHFAAMVKQAYAPVYRPRSVTFGALVEIDGQPVQKVRVVGPEGGPALALYYMEREADGTWRISGCQLLPDDSVGA
jgi:hypothetical protein